MKLNFYQKQNQLDEMQEQTLRKIESRSFWLLWWGLLALIAFQGFIGISPNAILGELLLHLLVSLYMVTECIRNGIWDRHFRPTLAANLAGALIGGGAVAVLTFLRNSYWPGALIAGAFTGLLVFFALQVTVGMYKKRHQQLENTEEENHESED
ncbi:DUF6773 family protein [Faecalibacterium gallinarum]|uniref:Uncharacterized protein n=1 Tax=Faecalibacterium gallinarum TaxID=2903556 RepID=A0AA37MYV0_9FIRM|nr:DUF6773 family protein [Faecalibacterium gallinarum]GJN64365.1 hypothetical protein JCM17207_09900 [Faecalibacterium gallinarum]